MIKQKLIAIYNSKWFGVVKFIFVALAAAYLFDNFRYWGLGGLLLVLLGYPIYNYIRGREHYNLMYKDVLNRTEILIWGKIRDTPRWKKKEDEKINKRKRAAAQKV